MGVICVNCGKAVTATHWYRSGQPRCWRRRWSKADDFRLMTLWERGMSDREIGAAMDRSADAVHLHRMRALNITGTTANRAVMTSREAARRLGLKDSKTLTRWIELGWLAATRGKGAGTSRVWNITEDAIRAFLADERYWVNWHPERITDVALRRYSDAVRGNVRFLTLGEAAERFCVLPATVGSWIDKGWITGYRPGLRGNHQVRLDEVERLAAVYVWGNGLREAA